jgi:hypothetical protein
MHSFGRRIMAGHYLRLQVIDTYTEVYKLVVFLTDVVGWEIAEDVVDDGDIRDVVFKSAGEPEVPNGFTRYIRIRNTDNKVWLHTYETFVSTTINTGEVSDATYGSIHTNPANAPEGFEVIVVADLERVIITHHNQSTTNVYVGYAGRITPYHRANEHRYPNLVKGSASAAYHWWYSANEYNCFMMGPHDAIQHYHAVQPLDYTGIVAGSESDRNGTTTLAAPVFVNTNADPQRSELVGEPRGVYRIHREVAQNNTFLKIDGEVYVTVVQSNTHFTMGPVGTEIPSLVPAATTVVPDRDVKRLILVQATVDALPNFTAHWDDTTIQSSAGTVTGWIDKTGNGWDLVPGATAPLHLVANQNGLDTIDFFTGSGYMNLDVSSAAPFSGSDSGTFYMVLITDTAPGINGRSPLDVTDGPYGPHHPWTNNQIYNDFGTTGRKNWGQNPAAVIHDWHTFSGVGANGNNRFDINGVLQYSTASTTVSWRPVGASPWVIGGGVTGAYEGRIGEVRFYADAHDDITRDQVTQVLRAKWGI